MKKLRLSTAMLLSFVSISTMSYCISCATKNVAMDVPLNRSTMSEQVEVKIDSSLQIENKTLPQLAFGTGIPTRWLSSDEQLKAKNQVGILELRLMDKLKEKLIKSITLPEVDDEKWFEERDHFPLMVFKDFFPVEGEYVIIVHWKNGKSYFERKIKIERGDTEVLVDMFFIDQKRTPPEEFDRTVDYYVATFTVSIVHPSGTGIELVRNWKPSPDNKPKYIIKNKTSQAIYCADPMSPFVGVVYKKIDENNWKIYSRGRTHDSRAHPYHVEANGERWCEETIYETPPIPFEDGHYQFRVKYLKQEWVKGIEERLAESGVYYEFFDQYELVDNFTIGK